MPDADAIRTTIEQYLARFSADDREGWLDLWADGATMEDPVGSPLRTGREEIGAFYDQGTSTADKVGITMTMPAIDVMTFDDDARITSQRAFVDFGMIRPAD
jgi:steroid delta-isomerase